MLQTLSRGKVKLGDMLLLSVIDSSLQQILKGKGTFITKFMQLWYSNFPSNLANFNLSPELPNLSTCCQLRQKNIHIPFITSVTPTSASIFHLSPVLLFTAQARSGLRWRRRQLYKGPRQGDQAQKPATPTAQDLQTSPSCLLRCRFCLLTRSGLISQWQSSLVDYTGPRTEGNRVWIDV